jgi:hypothetical protein
MKSYENKLDEILDVVIKLAWSYTILCALFEKKDADRQVREMHQEFFITMYDSLLCGFCTATALLFDKKVKATSICNLIRDIQLSKPELANKLTEKINAKSGLIKKITDVRHQACAHRWEAKTPKEVFTEGKLSLNKLKEIVDLTQSVLRDLIEETGKENPEKQQLSKETLQRITNDAGQIMRAFGGIV